ncbi:serine hydrolase [Patescibacteria group bacterium]|nr:serine hydrolase [Patescibacteria group bacterium]
MGPNFLNNIEGGNPIKDRTDFWRSILAVFLFVIALGGFIVNKINVQGGDNFIIKKILEPIGQKEKPPEQSGGDVLVEPPIYPELKLPKLIGEMLPSDNFTAHSIIVKDSETGMVLFRKNEYDKWPLASITKLMSALVILEKNPDWTTSTVVIGSDSLDTHMYAGDTYTLEELWNTALIASSNKAILSLANAFGWPEVAFVERMNSKARELGMLDTYFTDASGLDDSNVSTASDVVMILREVMNQEKIWQTLITPEYNLYSNEREKSHHMWNTDWLLLGWVPHNFNKFYGGKTGYITASGYNFTMRVGNEANNILDIVVLGANSHEARFTEARDVAEWVFENYEWPHESH